MLRRVKTMLKKEQNINKASRKEEETKKQWLNNVRNCFRLRLAQ